MCKCVGKQRNITYHPQQTNDAILFHILCPIESRVLSFNNSPKCMIKIFLESLTNSHNVFINMKKTKVMHLNLTEPHPQIMIDGEELDAVNDFTYL